MKDMHKNNSVVHVIKPVAGGTTGIAGGQLSAVIGRRGFEAVEFLFNSGGSASVADTITPIVYESAATGSGFRVSRSSLRCILAMSPVRKHRLASPSPCAASTLRIRSALASLPAGAISSSDMLSSVNSTRSAPSPLLRQAGARANSV